MKNLVLTARDYCREVLCRDVLYSYSAGQELFEARRARRAVPASLDDSDLEWAASDTPQVSKSPVPLSAAPRPASQAPAAGGRARRDADGRYVRPQLDSLSDSDSELELSDGKHAKRRAPRAGAGARPELVVNGTEGENRQQQLAQHARGRPAPQAGFRQLLSVQQEADEGGTASDGARGRAASDAPDGSSESDARSQPIPEVTVRRKSGQRLSGQLSLNENSEVRCTSIFGTFLLSKTRNYRLFRLETVTFRL